MSLSERMPGIPEQVPCAADVLAALEDRKCALGAVLLQVVGRPNAGDSRTDNQHSHVFNCLAFNRRILTRCLLNNHRGLPSQSWRNLTPYQAIRRKPQASI